MSARRVALGLVGVAVVFACTTDLPLGPRSDARPTLDERTWSEDCAPMIAALDTFALHVRAASLVIADSTTRYVMGPFDEAAESYRKALIDSLDLDPAIWADLIQRNETSVPLCHDVPAHLEVPAIRASALREAQADSLDQRWELAFDPWRYQATRHAGWPYVAEVSRVGRSSDGSQALVAVGGMCGGLCGSGWLIVLDRDGDHWRVRGMLMTWVS